jgi:hypothetical protein
MFIRAVQKKDKQKLKSYTYYRLTHSYRLGNKTRQIVVLNLGKLEGVDQSAHKILANRIEELVTGKESLFSDILDSNLELLAQEFAKKIAKEKIFPSPKGKSIAKEITSQYHHVDLESTEQLSSKDIGGEWLLKQAFDSLDLPFLLEEIGLGEQQVLDAQLLLIAKLLHPSSELEAMRWLNENSAAAELFSDNGDITRYKLYQAATNMYAKKKQLDNLLYKKIGELFPGRAKIVVYDLTNMYFEGQMQGSEKAVFGRSKQKRNDRRLIGLALSIDALGFVRHSQFYKGNVSEPGTFIDLIEALTEQLTGTLEKPLVVMDAGIATEDNLTLLRNEPYCYDYVCVSRTKPTAYVKIKDQTQTITDNRGHKIHLTKVLVNGKQDHYLHIKSDQKQIKENAMQEQATKRLEAALQQINDKLSKKGTLKKITKVHEKVGAIKAKLSRVGYLYEITYTEDQAKGIVTQLHWKRVQEKEKPKGTYFLRYTDNAIKENKIWDLYNLTRDVESVFRCLKTDLDIRPIYHQKDKYIEPHIWLGILSYQVVNYIKNKLKAQGNNDSWTSIVNKMRSMQASTVVIKDQKEQLIYIKLCTRPTQYQKSVFDILKYKDRPYVRKTKVVTQM